MNPEIMNIEALTLMSCVPKSRGIVIAL